MGIDYLRRMRFSLIHGEKMKNKYFYRSRISEAKFREIVRHFAMDINASKTALLCGVNRNTVNSIYSKIRLKIIEYTLTNIRDYGEFEVDESYFGARRVRGKRGRGAAGKKPLYLFAEKRWKSLGKCDRKL